MTSIYRACLLSALCLMVVTTSCVQAADQLAPVQKAIDMLAQKLNVAAADIKVVSVEGVDWPDTSLGAPQPGMMYLQVITPGYKVILEAGERRYEYHTDMDQRAVLASIDGTKVTEQPTPAQDQPVSQSAARCREDLARRLNIAAERITVSRARAVTFPDTSLGLPDPGMTYAKVMTPGEIITLLARNVSYLYTTAEKIWHYGGPMDAAQFSAVHLERAANEPNLNGNLVQVSLVGKNPGIVVAGVTDYRPQPNASIIAKRRTSRSGFDLLYVAPGRYGEATKLSSAFDFGDAAVNADGTRWVAFSRPGIGAAWQVSWGALAGGTETPGHVDLAGGVRPERIYWHMTNPVAAVREGEGTVYYELLLTGATPRCRKFGGFFAPPTEEFMLNKSETLMVKTEKDDKGQPVTRIVRQWFTGDERFVATIANFTPDEMSLTPGKRFLLLSGRRGDKTVGLTVDLASGEVLETAPDADGVVRLLLASPQGWIYTHLPMQSKVLLGGP